MGESADRFKESTIKKVFSNEKSVAWAEGLPLWIQMKRRGIL